MNGWFCILCLVSKFGATSKIDKIGNFDIKKEIGDSDSLWQSIRLE